MKVNVGQGMPAGERTLLARLQWPRIADLVQPQPSCSSREEIMPNDTDDQPDAPRGLSRRNLFKRAGIVGTLAATAGTTLALTAAGTARAQTPAPAAAPREALETLTAAESDILEAI